MNPFNPGYFQESELRDMGFKAVGNNVQIAKTCMIVGLENIEIQDNVRIDSYCTIVAAGAGWLKLGSFIHLGAHCHLSAGDGIEMEDFSGLSQGVKIYSRTDDYSGRFLTGPTVPSKYTGGTAGTVTLREHVVVGAGTVILPRVTIGHGASVGALSLVTKSLDPWGVYFGSPAKKLKERSKRLLELQAELEQELGGVAKPMDSGSA